MFACKVGTVGTQAETGKTRTCACSARTCACSARTCAYSAGGGWRGGGVTVSSHGRDLKSSYPQHTASLFPPTHCYTLELTGYRFIIF